MGEFGATRVLSVDRPGDRRLPGRPEGRGPAPAGEPVSPAAVLLTSTTEGKEIAGRLAIKLGSGLITDATDIAADGTTTQSVFAGNFTVTATVTRARR